MPTKQQIKGTVEIIKAVADAICDLKRVPSGHLYTRVMNALDIHQYQRVIEIIKDAGLIRIENDELIWIG